MQLGMSNMDLCNLKKALLSDVRKTVNASKYTAKSHNKPRNMGLGKLGDPSITFVRQFRWTLEGDGLPEQWAQKVKIDFKNKKIYVELIEAVDNTKDDIDIHKWLEKDLNKESLTFTTYDGCGYEIYRYVFTNFHLNNNYSEFDYANSDVSKRCVVLVYDDMKRTPLFKKAEKPKPYFIVNALDKETHRTKVVSRPQIDIEESEVNFLNSKAYVPGKYKWKLLKLHMDLDSGLHFVKDVSIKDVISLTLRDEVGALETWTLKDANIDSFRKVEDKEGVYYEIMVAFESVEYRNHRTSKGD